MLPSERAPTAQQAQRSMEQMRKMTKILTASTGGLERMLYGVTMNDGKSSAKGIDDGEDSDFSTSLIEELSDKCIDEDLENMVRRREEERKLKVRKESSVRPTRNTINRVDMSVLLFFLFRKCEGEVKASEVLRKHRSNEKFKKKILRLGKSKSIENPVETISLELRRMVYRADRFLKERCELNLMAEELFRIIYNILTKHDHHDCTLRPKETLIETKKFLSTSRPRWEPSEHFVTVLALYNV